MGTTELTKVGMFPLLVAVFHTVGQRFLLLSFVSSPFIELAVYHVTPRFS
jgi:hypothetical protein